VGPTVSFRAGRTPSPPRRTMKKIASFEAIDLETGNTLTSMDNAEDVRRCADGWGFDPNGKKYDDTIFAAFDDRGHTLQVWPIDQVLNGTFDADLKRSYESK